MILDTNVRLEAVMTTSANSVNPDFHICFIDYNVDGRAVAPAMSRGAMTHITDVVLLSAATGVIRNREITYIAHNNRDDTPRTYIIKTDDGSTERIVYRKTVRVGETLQYNKNIGWFVEAVV